MVASIWSSNSDITLTCWRIIHFNFLLTAAIFASICFCRASGLAFLLSLNFLFIRGYYISTRAEIVSTRVETFHIIAIFFNSVYRVEISIRDENLHIISPVIKESQTCQLPPSNVEIYPFWLILLPGKSIKSTWLWQICTVKFLHFKYFAIILFTLCFVTAYSRKNIKITDSRSSPENVADFVRKAAKTYDNKHKSST